MDRPTALYRMYDENDALLYVGITFSPRFRFRQHAADKLWWPLVDYIEEEWHQRRELAAEAEKVAIWKERPRYNIERPMPDLGWRNVRAGALVTLADGLGAWKDTVGVMT